MGEQGSLTVGAKDSDIRGLSGSCDTDSRHCLPSAVCSLLPEAARGLLALKLREMIPQPERVEPLVFGFYSLEQQGPGSQDLNCSLWPCQCSWWALGTEGRDC